MADYEELIAGFIPEFRRGTAVIAVLASLRRPTYGYALAEKLATKNMQIEQNTLYPLLRRLEKQGLISGKWETSGTNPRKYYDLTQLGIDVLSELRRRWNDMQLALSSILNEEDDVDE